MNAAKTSYLIIGSLILSYFPVQTTQAAASPEEQCFTHLKAAAKDSPAFRNLDLSKLKKTSGKNDTFKSQTFSLASHADFLKAFNTYKIPFFQTDIVNYPNNMDEVPNRYKFLPKVHKANRNNTASIIYESGTKANVDHWMSRSGQSTATDIQDYFSGSKSASSLDAKHDRQKVDGYYIDTRYMTFGSESDLDFAFPTRAANPANDGFYPSGRPVKDMREYLMYTHHLAPQYGGDFLSCELVRIVPQSPYKLKDFENTGKSIAWENYGGSKLSQTDVTTRNLSGGKFRQGNIRYTITSRFDENKNILRFDGINISYNNGNSFLNPYTTLKFFEESIRDARAATKTFLEMRRDFYNRIIASGMGIGGGATGAAELSETLADADWQLCAAEGEICSFTGTTNVRYGEDRAFNYKEATNTIACTNEIFGDPLVGTVKSCWYDSRTAAPLALAAPVRGGRGGGGGGSSVICTHYNKKGLLSDELYATETAYGKSVHPQLYAGYLYWAQPFVAWLEKNEWADVVIAPMVNAWAQEVAYQMGERESGNLVGRKMMKYGEPVTLALGHTVLVKNKNNAARVTPTGYISSFLSR